MDPSKSGTVAWSHHPEIEPGLRLSYTRSARPSYRGIEPPTQACRGAARHTG